MNMRIISYMIVSFVTCAADIVAMHVYQFHTRIVSYIFVSFVRSTADIVAVHVRKFQKHRDEQARFEFELIISMNTRIVSCIFVSFKSLQLICSK